MYFFDTHCHLQDERIFNQCSDIIAEARDVGVTHFLCCGSSEKDWDDVASLARRFSCVIPAFGLHPWYCAGRSDKWLDTLELMLHEFPQAAVGEIGLDHLLPSYDRDDQHRVFVEQIKCASRLHRAVSIHCRKAWGALIDLLTSCGGLGSGGAIHSYSGSADLISPLEGLGCSFSLSGSITYSSHKRVRSALMALPLNKLLLETDAPDIPPEGYAGPNVPRNIIHLLPTVARLRAIPVESLAERIYSHSVSLFGCT